LKKTIYFLLSAFVLIVLYSGYVDASSGYVIDASQLSDLWLRSDTAASDQTLWIRANDGSGWGGWDSFDLITA